MQTAAQPYPIDSDLPSALSGPLKQALAPGENVLATLLVDLDEQLHFAVALLALTDRRLLALQVDGPVRDWPLTAGLVRIALAAALLEKADP